MANENGNVWEMVSRYMGLAMLLPLSTLIGWAIGYGLDRFFHTHFLYIVFLLLGIASGFVELIRTLLKDTNDKGR